MSKSVTVIGGKVWTQRSVTGHPNVASGNVGVHAEEANEEAAGDSPEDAARCDWDEIQKGRRFTRRSKRS